MVHGVIIYLQVAPFEYLEKMGTSVHLVYATPNLPLQFLSGFPFVISLSIFNPLSMLQKNLKNY
jgi:hypothetical protein